jgi:TRAP-type C4-dicarboxylate transport system permease small subunit
MAVWRESKLTGRYSVARLGRWYVSLLKGTIAVLFAGLVVAAFYQVISRYVLGVAPAWAEEAARYLAIWVVLLTSALAIEVRAHISVDVIPNALPRRIRLVMLSLGWLGILGFLMVFLWESFDLLAIAKGQVTPGLGIPMVYVYWILPLAGICMLVSSGRAVWSFVAREVHGFPELRGE